MNSLLKKSYSSSKNKLSTPSQRIPVKHARNFQIILNQSTLSQQPVRRRDAELSRLVIKDPLGVQWSPMLQKMTRTLKIMQNLQHLYFFQYRSSMTDTGLKHLCSSLKRHKSLRKLGILCILAGFNIDVYDKGLYYVGQSLKGLSHLEALDLGFTNGFHITGKGISSLSKSLKTLVCLKRIRLSFANCAINDSGIKNLSKELKRFKRLESINLNFNNCAQITDGGLESVGEIFKRNPNLQRVCLNFRFCRKLTNLGLKYLGVGLENLIVLEGIQLSFSDCEGITYEGLESLVESLRNLKKLKEIDFSLIECFEIKEMEKERTLEALKEVTKVKLQVQMQEIHQARRIPEVVKKVFKNGIVKFGLIFLLVVWVFTYFHQIMGLNL